MLEQRRADVELSGFRRRRKWRLEVPWTGYWDRGDCGQRGLHEDGNGVGAGEGRRVGAERAGHGVGAWKGADECGG